MKKWLLRFCVLGLLAGCTRNPITGKPMASLISESQEVALGEEGNRHILSEYGFVQDQALQRYVQSVGVKLAEESHRPNLPWHFNVIDSPAVNAFALPGGYVYVTRGILAYINNEAELAGVLGHEVGHVSARHAAKQITKERFAQLGISVASTLSPQFGAFGNVADTPLSLLFLRFNRNDERQADRLGVEYSAKAGYDPREIGNFFDILRRLSDTDERDNVPVWLSTHPDPVERVQDARQQAQQWIDNLDGDKKKVLAVNRDAYIQNLDGLVLGSDPRQGFSEGPHFYSPEQQFQITFPLNWQIETTHVSTTATDPKGGAQIQVSVANVPTGTSAASYVKYLASKGLFPEHGDNITVNGLPGYAGNYIIRANGGLLSANAAFIEYRKHIFQIVGVTLDSHRYRGQMDQALYSFSKITDDHILHREPDRLKLYKAVDGDTLISIAGETSTPTADADALAILNRIAVNQPISAGRVIKTIERGN